MPARRPSVPAMGRAVLRRLPPRVRGAAFRALAPALRVGGTDAGLASLVVICELVDVPRLRATLDSVAQDAHAYREVLVVPVGRAAEAAARAETGDSPDPRLRLLPSEDTWQDAANAGADLARGRFLQFLRACDRRLPDALATMVEALDTSGSDLATGGVVQRGRPALWLDRVTRAAHGEARSGVSPGELPALAGDLGLGNKLFLAESWRRHGCRLGPLDGWLLSPTLAEHLGRVRRVDVVPGPVQEHLGGHGIRPFGSMPSPLRDLSLWCARAEQVDRALSGTALEPGWDAHVLDVALPGFLMDVERASDDEWDLLRALVTRYSAAGDRVAPAVRAESRALLWLTREGRRGDVEALGVIAQDLEGDVPSTVVDGVLVADWDCLPRDAPVEVRRLTADETPAVAAVQRILELDDGRGVDLFLRVDHLDLPAHDHQVLARTADGREVGDVVSRSEAAATRWGASRFHRALLVQLVAPRDATRLELEVRTGGVSRRVVVALEVPQRRADHSDRSVLVNDVRLEGEDLVVAVTGDGDLHLVDGGGEQLGTVTAGSPRLVLRHRHFGRDHWLGTGHYRLVTGSAPPTVSRELLARLPLEVVGSRHRMTLRLGPAGGLLVHLGPPLADDELGPWAQERLVREHVRSDAGLDETTLYFESYAGRSATDSPLAIHDGLRARRPDLTTYWGVLDLAQEVPAGARPVLLRSREWYDVLARAGCLVVNTDMEAWFRRRPGQVLLQTFHGYPSKGMGTVQWRAAQLPESRVRVLRARGVDTWSAIVTPTPEMTRHYREQYGYQGPAFEHGYPRNDQLVGPAAAGVRSRTRELLGVAEGQTAVLYAPTWREHLATRPRRADMVDFLDVDQAARELGDSHVILLRGHRFHHERPASPHVVDVTGYPEINDLILAADAAVVDYSSLRFDFALTGKPLVFLVPDLAEYATGTRSFLFPFEDSAPGPFVDDTDGVVEQLRDVPALRARWSDELDAFNATYNRWHDGRAAERVVDGLLALLDLPTP